MAAAAALGGVDAFSQAYRDGVFKINPKLPLLYRFKPISVRMLSNKKP
jgi:hypothetical protein